MQYKQQLIKSAMETKLFKVMWFEKLRINTEYFDTEREVRDFIKTLSFQADVTILKLDELGYYHLTQI